MRYLLYLFIGLLAVSACKKKDPPEFDRKAMLEQMHTVIINPAYDELKVNAASLNNAMATFNSSPSLDNLTELRTDFIAAYLTFEHVKCFDFGPALDYGLNAATNTYPTDTNKIKSNISGGSYVLGSADNIAAIGFPALDFLLYHGSDLDVINRFTVDTYAEQTKTYAIELTEKMMQETEAVSNAWEGNKASFIAADGNDVGSSTSLIYNGLVKDIELLKNAKIGIPSGQFSGGEIFPSYVEAFYSGESQQLALESMKALKTVFTGAYGLGFDDYMDHAAAAGAGVSSEGIINQFDLCYSKIEALGNPFSDDIPVNYTGFNEAFQEIKKLVAYTKTDVSSALGILITFSDTDGD